MESGSGCDFPYLAEYSVLDVVTAQLQALARQHDLTVNTVLQGCWALLLGQYSGNDDVVFGVMACDQPELLDGGERTLGSSNTILPVRVQISTQQRWVEWMRQLQQQNGLMSSDEPYSLTQEASPNASLSLSLFTPDNSSLTKFIGESTEQSNRRVCEIVEPTHCPLSLHIVNRKRLNLKIAYDEQRFDKDTIKRIASHLEQILYQMNQMPQSTVEQLSLITESEREQIITRWDRTQEVVPTITRAMREALEASWGQGKQTIEACYPMTPTQQGIMFQSHYEQEAGFYHAQVVLEIEQELQIEALRWSWQQVMERHAVLRTSFQDLQGQQPMQVVWQGIDVPYQFEDWRGLSGEEQQKQLQMYEEDDRRSGFSLQEAPLWRLHVVQMDTAHYQIVWSFHYIMLDGWSQEIIIQEVEHWYEVITQGNSVEVPLPRPYQDYVRWLYHQDLKQAEVYWREMLHGVQPAMPLNIERKPSADKGQAGLVVYEQAHILLSEAETARLQDAGRQHHLTLDTLLQGCWALMLSRYSGSEEVVMGVAVSGRSGKLDGMEQMVGLFINSLPLRVQIPRQERWIEWMQQLQQQIAQMRQYEYSPLLLIQQWSGGGSGSPLFENVLTFESYAQREGTRWLQMQKRKEEDYAPYPLSIVVVPGKQLEISIHYDTQRFDGETVERMLGHLRQICGEMVKSPQARLGQLSILTKKERVQILEQWNATQKKYAQDLCIHQLFERQVQQSPEAVAILFQDQQWTYQELNRLANQVARYLKELGIGPGKLVAVLLERSMEMIPALLGILKAGAAYVPLDAKAPIKRWHWILDSLNVTCVITQHALSSRLMSADALPALEHILCMDAAEENAENQSECPYHLHMSTEIAQMPQDNLPVQGKSEDLAYIIFTSGSTGTPKGVMIAHFPVINLIEWVNGTFDVGPADRILFVTSLSFDLSVYDIFGILAAGGSIRIASRQDIQEPTRLLQILSKEPITFWDSAPAALMQLTPFLPSSVAEQKQKQAEDGASPSLRLVFLSGDWIPVYLPDHLKVAFPGVRVIGLGGATEATVWSNYYPIEEVDPSWPSIPYGKPIQNACYYILDESLCPCPIGVPGYLYIGGVCLSLGYANEPELTAEKFLSSPFSTQPDARIYKTGDLARWLPDGNIEFLGRTDSQVKIRGYRIELGEIETVLAVHPVVREAVVVVRKERSGDARLVSYVILDQLRAQAASRETQAQLVAARLKLWQQVYETFDQQDAQLTDKIFDFSGWNSSYTGQRIAVEEMYAWQEDTLALVRAYHPQTVLEIGCGTGLLLFPLAPQCIHYYGTDFSAPVLKAVEHRLAADPHVQATVTLLHRQADDLSGLPEEQIDTVLINSVIQYFPDMNYLLHMLEGALRLVVPGGRIIIGDVRSFPLLEAFHAGVQLARAPETLTRQQLWQQVQQQVQQEEELTLDPAFFWHWARSTERIQRVEVRLKRGRYLNEMTQFRYQVILHVGEAMPAKGANRPSAAEELNWSEQAMTLQRLREKLTQDQPSRLRLRQVPNARVEEATQTLKWLRGEPGPETVEAWRAKLRARACTGVEPEDIWEQAEQLGYDATISWGHHGADGNYTVLLERKDGEHWGEEEEERIESMQQNEPVSDWQRYANNPLRAEIERLLVPQLQQYLHERLPEYMIPANLVILNALPMTANGKLDRQALAQPQVTKTTTLPASALPRTNTEALLGAIWEQVLAHAPIGIFENFFELGGHSLLAVQLVARIRQIFALEVPVRLFFEHPTIAEVAHELERLQQDQLQLQMPPLLPVPRTQPLPATFDQQRLWFLDRLHPDSVTYTVNWLLPWSGVLEVDVLKGSLQAMVQRHETLRTTFQEEKGQVWQIIAEHEKVVLSVLDLCSSTPEQRGEQAKAAIRDWWRRPFDLAQGPLLRTLLVQLSETEQVLAFSAHHTIFDGYSIGLFGQELHQLYQASATGAPSPLPDLSIQYADYAAWQQQWLQEEQLKPHLTYWKEHLAQAPELITLPTDHPRPAVQSFQGALLRHTLTPELTQQLKQVSREHQVTLFITLLSSFATLLSRYSGQEMVVIGIPIANRSRVELEPLIGFLVNTVALCVDLRGNPSFEEILKQVRQQLLEAQSHQEMPFERLVEELQPERSLSYNPIFQVMFADEDLPLLEHITDGQEQTSWMRDLVTEGMSLSVARFDLSMMIQETAEGLLYGFEYSTDLFEGRTIARMAKHFQVMLQAIQAQPEQHVHLLPLLTEDEKVQILEQWNATQTEAMPPTCFHELFAEQARKGSDVIALVYEDQQLTYGELDRRANQLAQWLQKQGVGPEVLVGLCVERSLEMIIGLLGILKAGGAYVPLDPHYPQERLAFMIQDAHLHLLLTQTHLQENVPAGTVPMICLDVDWPCIAQEPETAPCTAVTPENLAYVIYTSGSTGKPKGVQVPHRGFRSLTQWQFQNYGLQKPQRVLQCTSLSFDISVWEITVALLAGGTLHLPRHDLRMLGSDLYDLLAEQAIENVSLTPSALATVPHTRLPSLRVISVGGEACSVDLVHFWAQERAFFNGYGPTEATICASLARYNANQELIHIGRPIANVQLYILDPHLQPVPVGVPGELYIGGIGIARGYLGRPELTAEYFIANPFSKEEGSRLYKTGDLVRHLPDGNIEFLGRVDQQVKIRGYRIELEEIETVLAQHPQVKSCAVLVQQDGEHKRLVAYVVPQQPADGLAHTLRAFLDEALPTYMVPSAFMFLEALPLSANGKLDRRALPTIRWDQQAQAHSYVAPRTPVEATLARIWQEVLGLTHAVGIHENFFALGGDSILSLQVIFRAKQEGLHFTVKQLFQHQTLARLNAVVQQRSITLVHAQQGIVWGPVVLTPIQRWFFAQQFAQAQHWNQAFLLKVPTQVSLPQWELVLSQLLQQHDALRTRFVEEPQGWQAEIMGMPATLPWQVRDLSSWPTQARAEQLLVQAQEVQASLRLHEPPLFRAVLFVGLEPQQHRLLLVAHHLVVDMVSWRILLEDLAHLLAQVQQGQELRLPAKTSSWQHWASSLQQFAQQPGLLQELPYWLEQVDSCPATLPLDGPGGPNTIAHTSILQVQLSEQDTEALLHEVPAAFNTQINDVLLTAVAEALGRWMGSEQVVLALEGHGREELSEELSEEIDLSRTVGWFTTLSPMRLPVPAPSALGKGLKQIKELLRQRPRRGLGYGLLRYEHAEPIPALAHDASVQVSFNYLGQFDQTFANGLTLAPEAIGPEWGLPNARPYLIDINSLIQDGVLQMQWTYNAQFHQPHTIQQVAQRCLEIIQQLIQESQRADLDGYSPSDLPLCGLDQTQLAQLITQVQTLPLWHAQRTQGLQRPLEDCYPQTPMQQGLWFQSQYAQGQGFYHVQLVLELTQEVQLEAFRQSWQQVMHRHPILRTSFWEMQEHAALQLVWREVPVPLALQDWRTESSSQQQARLQAYLQQERVYGFAPQEVPQWRMLLAHTGPAHYQLVWSAHHAIVDGWSTSIILTEVAQCYAALTQGQPIALQPVRPYRDYVSWLHEQDLQQAEQYWRATLHGVEQATPLGVERRGVTAEQHATEAEASEDMYEDVYEEVRVRLSEEETAHLQAVAQAHHLTLNTLLQGCWALVLSRYSRMDEVIFGVVVSGRPAELAGVEQMIGLFINTLPLRVRVPGQTPWVEWMQQLQEQNAQMRQYEYSPLVQVQRWSELPAGSPLFESLFVFENYPIQEESTAALGLRQLRSEERTHYPLSIAVGLETQLEISIHYDIRRFDEDTVARMLGHIRQVCHELGKTPQTPLAQLSVLTEQEQALILEQWNATQTKATPPACLHELFAEQARKGPDVLALVYEDQQLSYGELDRRANQLAQWLQKQGVGPEVLVGLCVERSPEMLIGLLGILKAGGAYVPLDPHYPQERLAFMIQDAHLHLLLTQEHLRAVVPAEGLSIISIDTHWSCIAQEPETAPCTAVTPENLAYVIYTSGATGKPKGVQVPHRGFHNLTQWQLRAFHLHEPQRVLQVASFSFDISVWEIIMALLTGGTLHLPHHDLRMLGSDLYDLLAEQAIENVTLTPSALATLPQASLPALRTLIVGGDACPVDLMHTWAQRSDFFDGYGPTETTICGSVARCGANQEVIHIGRPITNVQYYILDPHLQPVPVGVPGELYIGGIGTARGYLGRPELTAEYFIANPFSKEEGSRLYKTGDLVRYLSDGNVEFLGRVDQQVKIRGYRIELGEIETVLAQHPQVKSCAVLAQQDGEHKRLVAYVVPQQPTAELTDTLRAFLDEALPTYMVPSAFMFLEALPLSANGKLDRRALPAIRWDQQAQAHSYVAPRTPVEATLARIWQEVLGLTHAVGIHENFFALGGDSILSLQVIFRAKQEGLHFTVKQLFQHQTLARLSAVVQQRSITLIHAQQGMVWGPVVLTPIQHWFFAQQFTQAQHWNQAFLLKVPTQVSLPQWELVLSQLLQQHDALRTRFVEEPQGWQAEIMGMPATLPWQVRDLSSWPAQARAEQLLVQAQEVQASLRLQEPPLFRAVLFVGLEPQQPRLLLVAHHLVVDMVSWRILLEDLAHLLTQVQQGQELRLPAKTSSWQHWASRLQLFAQQPGLLQELPYWLEQVGETAETAGTVTTLPLDGPGGPNTVAQARTLQVQLSEQDTEALLREVPAAFNTQINDVLLTAVAATLGRWMGCEQVMLALEGHGREELSEELSEEIDLSRTVGWFTTLSPVRLPVPAPSALGKGLKQIKELLWQRPRRGLGYGLLRYEHAEPIPALAHDASAQVSFNYLGQFDQTFANGLALAPEAIGPEWGLHNERPYLIDINSLIQDGVLQMQWTYNAQFHQPHTIQQVAQRCLEIIQQLIQESQRADLDGYSPSDLPLCGLDQTQLAQLITQVQTLPLWHAQRAQGLKRPLEDCYPQTPAQQGLWFQSQYAQGQGFYHVQLVLEVAQEVQLEAFRQSWQQVMHRHPILRTSFWEMQEREALQLVWREVPVPLALQDWRTESSSQQQARLQAYLQQERVQGFAPQEVPQWRMLLAHTGPAHYHLVWSAHHTIVDGWSTSIILAEVAQYYAALTQGQPMALKPVRPYRDYVRWLQAQDLQQAEQYWRATLQGVEQATPLSVERRGITAEQRSTEAEVSEEGYEDMYEEMRVRLSEEETAHLQAVAQAHHLTLNTLLQGCWALVLSRYSRMDEVIFGVVVSGRPAELEGVEQMIGLFINTLPLRVQVPGQAPWVEWMQQLQEQNAQMRQYEYSPLVQVQRWSELPAGSPLFESLFVFENYPIQEEPTAALNLRQLGSEERSHYPLSVVVGLEKQLEIGILYDTRRFDEGTVARMLGHIQQVCHELGKAPQTPLAQLSVLTNEERAQILEQWNVTQNATQTEATPPACLHELFAEQARRVPDVIALVYEDQQLTYGELDRRANQLAQWLQKQGVGPEVLVGLCVERSLEVLIGLLGILKAGGAYVPLDPHYPQERLAFMIQDAHLHLLLTQAHLQENVPAGAVPVISLDADWPCIAQEPETAPPTTITPENLAYVIYTSGSTGKPKGVLVVHRCLQHVVPWQRQNPCFYRPQRVLQVASFSFDFSVWEIIMPLLTGGTLHLPPHDLRMIGSDLYNLLEEQAIENLNFTPAALATLPLAPLPALRTLVVGGEAYSVDLIRKWAQGRNFFNVYGPTETTIFASGTLCDANQEIIHIGRPITNVRLYILDPHLQPVPVGVPGELYIGGVGVTRGYLGRPELTAEYFIANPFSDEEGSRLYKSGDLVRYLPDGNIEFVGRVDQQVKIRGFRIELGEIEVVLARHPQVKSCAVLVQQDGENKRLVAYIVPQQPTAELTDTLRAFLSEELPTYMVPSAFVFLEALPLSTNGKLDRQALPLPESVTAVALPASALPRTNTEALLGAIWEQVLAHAPIGIFENFFELGGHSLLAVQLVARIRQVFALEVPVRLFFEHPTIAEVAHELERLQHDQLQLQMPPLLPVPHTQPLPATFDQQRLWFLDRLHPNSAFYTVNWLLPWSGVLELDVLKGSLQAMVRRHETLRTTFREEEGQVWQIIAEHEEVVLSVLNLCSLTPEQQGEQAKAAIRDWWRRPFDLAQGPLLRTLLVQLSETKQVLALSAHHIISDGYSIGLFDQELHQLYQAVATGAPSPLPDLSIQFADYAAWQQQWLQEEQLKSHLTYWKEHLAQAPELITLPTDHPRPAVQSFQGATLSRALTPELTQQLKQVSREHQVTLFITLLSSFATLLSRYSGQEMVVIGIPIANRSRVELEPLIGFLVNTVALCVDLRGNPSFEEVLKQVRQQLLEAQNHQEMPFERIVEELQPERSLSYSPIFQVMFTGLDKLFEDELTDEQEETAWMQTLMEGGLGVAKFDIGLSIQERKGRLQYAFEYSTDLFEERTIARMAEHFQVFIQAALANPQQRVCHLPLLTEGEKVQILEQWNATQMEETQPACLHKLIEEQARKGPDVIALVYEDQQLTYGELDRHANQLAHLLQARGIGPDARVGICAERSPEMVIGLLGILKAGGAYVPLDPHYPQERLAFMVQDAQLQAMLVQQHTRTRVEGLVKAELLLDGEQAQWPEQSAEAIADSVQPDNLAYVIYTSGSTGVPKGAMLSHRGICNRLLWMQKTFHLEGGDRVLQKTPFTFDVSVWEFFWPLLVGAQLHLARPEGHRDPAYLAELIARQSIEVLHFVPSMLQAFLEQPAVATHCGSVKHVICSGEALPLELQERFLQRLPDLRLHNLYGPTEASVDVSFWECHHEAEASSVPIGRPVANTQLYILNTALLPVPEGVIGELYIGGIQLARGYLGRPELTAERFVPNPFSKEGGTRLYATGDLARYRRDGAIEYMGRRDQQVKIRGHRIEVEEIEAVLAQHPSISSCLILVHEVTATDKRLAAYYTCREGHEVNLSEVKDYLLQKLPEYMLPAYFVPMKEFALTANGKVDRKALPSPLEFAQTQTDDGAVGPRTETEKGLAEIWMDLLGVDHVNVNDDFFTLGGHSLLVAYLATEVQSKWDISLMLPVVFQNRTLEALAQVIDQSIEEMQMSEETGQMS